MPPWSADPSDAEQVARDRRDVHANAASRSPWPAGAAACPAASVPVFGGVVLDVTGLRGLVASTRPQASSRSTPARSDPHLEADLASTGSVSGTSRRASSSPPSAVGSPAAAPASTRPATARSRTWSSGSRSCSPTAGSCARAGRRRRPSDPTSTSCSSVPRARSASSPGCGCEPTPTPPAERRAAYTFESFADGIEACRRVLRAGATPAVMRLYDAIESAARGGAVTALRCTLLVLDEGDELHRRRHDGSRGRRAVRTVRRRRGARRRMAGAPQRHQRAAGSDAQGLRRRHDGDRRAVEPAGVALRRRARGAAGGAVRRRSRRVTSRTATPTAPASTSRSSPSRRPTRSSARTSRCGTPASAPCWPAAGTCRTTTASASTAPASSPRRSGRDRGARGPEAGARPDRHPEPRQARDCHPPFGPPAVAVKTRVHSARGRPVNRWDVPAHPARWCRWCSPSRSRSRPASPPTTTTAARGRARARRGRRVRHRCRMRRLAATAGDAAQPRHGDRGRHVPGRPSRLHRRPAGPVGHRSLVRRDLQPQLRARRRSRSAACSVSACSRAGSSRPGRKSPE